MKATITFCGGAGSVTGANFLFELYAADNVAISKRILIDCGFYQGSKVADDKNREKFSYNPAEIDYLLITHAHLDHIGRIPKLVRDGFQGQIYSTPPTRDIAELSLIDSMGVLEKEARGSDLPPMYTEKDVEQAMRMWETRGYREAIDLGAGVTVTMRDAGHILGSAMFEIGVNGKKVVFTGDLGNSPSLLLPDTETITDADYLLIESVYGDRNHENREQSREQLENLIEETMHAGGTLMIPAFSIERTQEILYEIERMMGSGRVPPVPVFLDSPLAINVTSVYKKHIGYFNQRVANDPAGLDGLFNFPQLQLCLKTDDSKAIAAAPARKIVIAGSGMSNGGRILHHEKRYLSDPNSALLLAGYQAAGSLGRQLQEGAKRVRILGEEIEVRAKIHSVSGYSGHKGSDDLLEFVAHSADTLKGVFVAMGEPKSSLYLVQKIRDYLGLPAVAPEVGEKVELAL